MWGIPSCGVLPVEDEMGHPGHNLLFQWERGGVLVVVDFPLVENSPSPSLKWLLLGLVCAEVYSMHAKLINQCLKVIVTENRYCL